MIIEYPNVEGNGDIYLDVLKAICGDTKGKSMADLMCYHAPYTPKLGFEKRAYVDIQFRGLDFKEEEEFFIQDDAIKFAMKEYFREVDFWDVMICSDGIEHLKKDDGRDLIFAMGLAAKKEIIFTPTRDFNLSVDDNPDTHKSSWTPNEFLELGYGVINFPDYHRQINLGAFFAWYGPSMKEDFERVIQELKNKIWANGN